MYDFGSPELQASASAATFVLGVVYVILGVAMCGIGGWLAWASVDLRGVFLCMKYEIPLMLAHGGGAIVNTSSGAGVIGIKNNAAYTAAATVVWMCSDAAGFMVGHALVVDGGQTII